ncbi:MAG: PAS domain S-box protein [Myxococcales bacterium]
MGLRKPANALIEPLDADLARAEANGLRDLRMVLDDLQARGLPRAADDFPWPTFMHDGERILQANPACLRWFGCSGDGALSGQPLAVLCRPEDEPALLAAVGATAAEPPPSAHIQRFCTETGKVQLGRVLSRREPVDGAHVTFTLIAPTPEQDRSFELLRLLGEAVDHLTDIVFITEAHAIDEVGRRIVFVNRAFTEASGYDPSEVLGKTPNVTIGEGTDRKVLARLEAGLRQVRPVREDLLKYAKDGTPYWVELQILPMFDEAGEHSHWISIQRDISERKRMEARLLESARLAAAGQLSASLSSELNSPLASVVSSLEWLADRLPQLLGPLGTDASAREVLEALADARASAARLASATGYLQLLGDHTPTSRQTLLVAPVVEQAIVEAEQKLARVLSVERSFEPELMVSADPARLSHAVRLAILNGALTSKNALRIEIGAAGQRVHVAVEDDGPGIAQEMAGTLNNPFEARKPHGIGDALGLFVASRLVAELDGELLLLPRVRGTRVEIRLPRGAW